MPVLPDSLTTLTSQVISKGQPKLIASGFSQLGLADQLIRALAKIGWTEATSIQKISLPAALTGKDIIVSAQTGSGKTAVFILPLIHRILTAKERHSAPKGLILAPTRELAVQTHKVFKALARFTDLKSVLLIGGEPFKHQIAKLRSKPEVVIATPGRLVEHIEKDHADLTELDMLVFDEADRMLDMGFADAIQKVVVQCSPRRQSLLFSATLKHKDYKTIEGTLKNPLRIQLAQNVGHNSRILQQRVLVDSDKHKEALVASLIAEEQVRRVIVFCNTRIQAERLSHVLRYKKLKAAYIHGEVSQNQRKQIMNRFLDSKIHVLVATDLAARGLDIDDIGLVINFTVPNSGDEYTHRIGRCGRAGQPGKAISLVSAAEWNRMSSIERYLKIRCQPRRVESLPTLYKGPKKVKKSGKACGKPKRKASAKRNTNK